MPSEYNTEDQAHDDYFKDKHPNKFSKGQRVVSNPYRKYYDEMKWDVEKGKKD